MNIAYKSKITNVVTARNLEVISDKFNVGRILIQVIGSWAPPPPGWGGW
jgi:hypothetical protein